MIWWKRFDKWIEWREKETTKSLVNFILIMISLLLLLPPPTQSAVCLVSNTIHLFHIILAPLVDRGPTGWLESFMTLSLPLHWIESLEIRSVLGSRCWVGFLRKKRAERARLNRKQRTKVQTLRPATSINTAVQHIYVFNDLWNFHMKLASLYKLIDFPPFALAFLLHFVFLTTTQKPPTRRVASGDRSTPNKKKNVLHQMKGVGRGPHSVSVSLTHSIHTTCEWEISKHTLSGAQPKKKKLTTQREIFHMRGWKWSVVFPLSLFPLFTRKECDSSHIFLIFNALKISPLLPAPSSVRVSSRTTYCLQQH